jgi:putative FmdB family regulatory protein
MPIYEYLVVEGATPCENCKERFEIFQKVNDPVLNECPECGAPIQRVFSVTSKVVVDKMSNAHLKGLGFSKYQKNCDGKLEKKFGPPLSSYD